MFIHCLFTERFLRIRVGTQYAITNWHILLPMWYSGVASMCVQYYNVLHQIYHHHHHHHHHRVACLKNVVVQTSALHAC